MTTEPAPRSVPEPCRPEADAEAGARAGGPLRVLHCAAGNLFGGVETLLRTLAETRALCPGIEPEFALCFGGRLEAELRAAGGRVNRLGEVRFSRPWTVWRARRRLARLLADRRSDVVVGHGCWAHLLCAPTARRAGRGVVFWMHDRISGAHWVERRAARVRPDLVLANSHGTAATLPALFPGMCPEILRYPVRAPAAIRPGDRAAVRAELGAGPDDVVIVMASRLEPWKGHALLIAALGHLRDMPGWVAWIAGGPQRPHEQTYLETLQTDARTARVGDRVRFLGDRRDVPRLLAAADIHCQPNLGPEPFGIAFIEALYAGLPVVSTGMGGAAEIVTEACGVLVSPGAPDALAGALTALIADPGTRARLGAAGPARAAALCDPAQVLARFDCLLRMRTVAAPRCRPGST